MRRARSASSTRRAAAAALGVGELHGAVLGDERAPDAALSFRTARPLEQRRLPGPRSGAAAVDDDDGPAPPRVPARSREESPAEPRRGARRLRRRRPRSRRRRWTRPPWTATCVWLRDVPPMASGGRKRRDTTTASTSRHRRDTTTKMQISARTGWRPRPSRRAPRRRTRRRAAAPARSGKPQGARPVSEKSSRAAWLDVPRRWNQTLGAHAIDTHLSRSLSTQPALYPARVGERARA